MTKQFGPVVLLGSGETAPNAQKIYHRLFSAIGDEIRVAILETPAGFEPNSADVAAQVGRYVERHLQNFRPSIDIIPARKKGLELGPDNHVLADRLNDANVILMGPGSPTYTTRNLRDTVLWQTLLANHRLGAAVVFASAATLAMSRHTMPIYEIYKVGEDLHWKQGLDFFGAFGLSLIFVSHWNNNDGGKELDTSRCYVGQERFGALLNLLPGGVDAYTVVGIDENTALFVDPRSGQGTVFGVGGVTIIRNGKTNYHARGDCFALEELGPFRLPQSGAGIPDEVWRSSVAGRQKAEATRQTNPQPEAEVLIMVQERAAARARMDWEASDRIRAEITARGWHVIDTPEGPLLEPAR